jgi:Flp pilus assembly protein TadD
MMKLLKATLLVAFVLLMAGCATQQTQTVTKERQVPVLPPDELLKPCSSSALPPNKDKYLASTWKQKEDMLVSYATSLLTDLDKCSSTVENVRGWKTDQAKNYDKKEDKP